MDKKLIQTLAKVIVAAAWADKKLAPNEINSLKDLLFGFQRSESMKDIRTLIIESDEEIDAAVSGFALKSNNDSGPTARQSAMFEMYTESPIVTAEREYLVDQLRTAVWTEEDKTLVLSALKRMIEADGTVTQDEIAVLNEIKANIETVHTGIFSQLGRLMESAIQRRSQAVDNVPNREKYFEEFLKNKVYYEVRRRLDLGEAHLKISDEILRKLSMAGGLMARVAQTDGVVLDKEKDKIISILEAEWGISKEEASFVVEVAMYEDSVNFDYLRMSREFLEITTRGERVKFLDVLFAVADADGKISNDELTEIHHIADYLLMSYDSVMEARSKYAN